LSRIPIGFFETNENPALELRGVSCFQMQATPARDID
jgi:hypothetical protein